MTQYNTLDDIEVHNKTVLVRVDFNLPLDKETLDILDTTRIKLVLPTLKELKEKNAKTVILAHQGRKDSWDFISLEKHAQATSKLLGEPVQFVEDIYGDDAQQAIQNLEPGGFLMLDNVRKYPQETNKATPEEHAQTPFVKTLSKHADVFVNDAFAAAHRSQCSLVGFTATLPSCAGRLMEKELATLEKIVKNPEHPSVFLFGGAKYSDVVVTVDRVLQNKTADKVLLTGLPANAFLKAQGIHLGKTNEDALMKEGKPELFEDIKRVLNQYKDAIYLPIDFAIEHNNQRQEITIDELPLEQGLFDIGKKTISKFQELLEKAETVFLSGPCGVFENPQFKLGTKEIFTTVAHGDAFSIVGGGHTVAAVEQLNLKNKMSHISSGGGSLEKFMMGEPLVVVEALKQAKQSMIDA